MLVGLHALLQTAKHYSASAAVANLAGLFDLDREANIPATFQGFTLLAAAFLVFIVARHAVGTRDGTRWLILTLAIGYMACDELASLHERASAVVRLVTLDAGQRSFAGWILIMAPVAIAVAAFLSPLIRAVPARIGVGLATAGVIYFAGAIGMEIVAWAVLDEDGFTGSAYLVAATFEEAFEMAGIIVLVQVLLHHLRDRGYALTIAARD